MNFENKYLKYKKKYFQLKNNLKSMKGGANLALPDSEIVLVNHNYWTANCGAFSNDGKYIVSGSNNGNVKIWSTETGDVVRALTGHTRVVTSVAFSRDGKYVVSGSNDKSVKIWSTKTGDVKWSLTNTEMVTSVAFSNDGKYVVSGSHDKSVKIWSTETGNIVHTLTDTGVWSVAFSSDGKYVVSGSDDKSVKIWSTATGDVVRSLTGHTNAVYSVAFSNDGKYVVSGSADRSVKIWSTETGDVARTLTGHIHPVMSVAFSSDGKYVVSSSLDGTINVWVNNEGIVGIIYDIKTTINAHCVAFSPDNKHLLIYRDNNIIQVRGIITDIMQLEEAQATRIKRAAIAAFLGNSAYTVPIHDHLIGYIMNFYEAKKNQMTTNWDNWR